MSREISLRCGRVVIVDDEDYAWIAQMSWRATIGKGGHVYAVRSASSGTKLMHRLIMNAPSGMVVDHANGNGLDNRKSNLRICTQRQNSQNIRVARGLAPFKGVYRERRALNRPFSASISVNGKPVFLGKFRTAEEGAIAYDVAAKAYFGQFAATNADIHGKEISIPKALDRRLVSAHSRLRRILDGVTP